MRPLAAWSLLSQSKKVMDVYDAVKDITDPKVPAYMKSLVNGADAEKAYQGFLEFKDVVAANQVTTASAAATVPTGLDTWCH